MDPEEIRKKLKKVAIVASFFVAALVFYALEWRLMLKVYLMTVAVLSVLVILIQSGRGGGLAASLGGMGGDSLLGARSATPIAKATYVMLGLFIFICVLVARMGPVRAPGAEPAAPPPVEQQGEPGGPSRPPADT